MIASEYRHKIRVFKRSITQGPDGEPVPSYDLVATLRGLVDSTGGRLERDTTERKSKGFKVYTESSDLVKQGHWIQAVTRSQKGDVVLMTGQVLEVKNPNFKNDHLELRVQDGGDPISTKKTNG